VANDFQEVLLDDLMIDLFSLIADQIRDKQELFDEEGKIMQALLNNGYHIHEADAALMLMQTFVQRQSESFFTPAHAASSVRIRTMNKEERERFSIDAFGFVSKLTRLGIISEEQREDLLEKALMVHTERIELDTIKSLIAFTLFAHPHDRDHNDYPNLRRIKRTAWN
jgi:uncharacterized protein Smg (DUF494 family)